MVKIGVEREGLAGIPLMARSAEMSFGWMNHKYSKEKPLMWKLDTLAGVPKLFIEAADDPELGGVNQKMFKNAPGPEEQKTIPRDRKSTRLKTRPSQKSYAVFCL